MVVVDELHKALNRRHFSVVRSIPAGAVFGLTATLRLGKAHTRLQAYGQRRDAELAVEPCSWKCATGSCSSSSTSALRVESARAAEPSRARTRVSAG